MGRIIREDKLPRGSLLSKHIGSRLLTLRQTYLVSMKTVADGSGLSFSFICELENGHCSPTAETLWKLATYFKVTPQYFFDGFTDPQADGMTPDTDTGGAG